MIEEQVYVFFWSIVIGIILALIFDFFRLMRRKGNTRNWVVYIQDIIYWFIVAIIIIASAFVTNDGELRGYMFVGYILGAIFYLMLFSKMFLNVIGKILDFIGDIAKKCCNILLKPLHKLQAKKKNVKI